MIKRSPIKKKKCKAIECDRYPILSGKGYCAFHLPDDVKEMFKSRKKMAQANANKRRSQGTKLHAIQKDKGLDRYEKLTIWFFERGKEMEGTCVNCGGKTCKGDLKYEKFSAAHLLSKAIFPSVATHPLNFAELCFWGNSCHTNFDNLGYENCKEKMPKLWAYLVDRFQKIYPMIAEDERHKVPQVLIDTIKFPDQLDFI
jgi:hypothetical protein